MQSPLLREMGAACRASGTTKQVVTTTRGPGQFIGEVSLFEGHSGDAQWKTCVRARGSLKALLLTRGHLRTLLQRAPEAEAAVRAGAARLTQWLPLHFLPAMGPPLHVLQCMQPVRDRFPHLFGADGMSRQVLMCQENIVEVVLS